MTRADDRLTDWLASRRLISGLSTREIPWKDCRAWGFSNGRLSHMTGGFFSVIGVCAHSNLPGLDACLQPIIDQPETGILGFVVRKTPAGHEWLLQAKAEPGNIGDVQIAPSVQATRSNYTCLHGGTPTSYLDMFIGSGSSAVPAAQSLQSEHGNRFLGKYNLNMTVVHLGEELCPVSPDWLWGTSTELRSALMRDVAVNTDARSVLFSTDWSLLADGEPFGRWAGNGGWGEQLLNSFHTEDENTDRSFFDWLAARRRKIRLNVRTIPLDDMNGWEVTPDGIISVPDGLPRVKSFSIKANYREVNEWDQPLMLSSEEEAVIQICQCRDGIMKFLLRASAEIGFREIVQLGPTLQSDDVTRGNGQAEKIEALIHHALDRYSTIQSDEGGRFFRSVCRYRILELPEDVNLDVENDGYRWASLAQINRLSSIPGIFTNEARSALSMLLSDV